eukprot:240580-Alexandrium_andersonii.AAC.1
MPLAHSKRWLGAMEPVACGEAALKAIVKRGSREQSRTALDELVEFMTGIDPGQYLFEAGRDSE